VGFFQKTVILWRCDEADFPAGSFTEWFDRVISVSN
jgi:hypothetical protein